MAPVSLANDAFCWRCTWSCSGSCWGIGQQQCSLCHFEENKLTASILQWQFVPAAASEAPLPVLSHCVWVPKSAYPVKHSRLFTAHLQCPSGLFLSSASEKYMFCHCTATLQRIFSFFSNVISPPWYFMTPCSRFCWLLARSSHSFLFL